jgi:hypothetical protein
MVRQASGQSIFAYVHAVKQHFDELNECLQLKDGSAAIHPHVLALVMIRGLSNVGQFGQAKQCVINAFDTNFIMSADKVMSSIIHHAQNLDDDSSTKPDSVDLGIPVYAFLADRKRQGGRGIGGWITDKKKSKLVMKCGACGDPNHVWSTCKAPYVDVLRWTLAKRKHIAEKYAGQPPPNAHLSDLPTDMAFEEDAADAEHLEYDMQDEFDDTEVGTSFAYVAFASSASTVTDMSEYWVVDSACSVNLTAFRSGFAEFHPSSRRSNVGGVGVTVQGSGTVRIPIGLVSGHTLFRRVHALYTPDLSSRYAQHISRMLSVSWMQKHYGCEFSFPTNSDSGMLLVTT